MKQPASQPSQHDNQASFGRSLARNKAVEVSTAPVSRRQLAFRRLAEACKAKDLDRIKLGLAEKPELANQRDDHNRTLLHYVSILVHCKEHNNCRDGGCENAQKSIECLDYLTDRCDLRLWWQQDLDGLSLLHLAVISSNVCLVKHVIFEHPYSIKYPLVCTLDNELHSPLHWAVITNNLDCVRSLIEFAGTKLVHEPDLNGATPLHYATQTSDYPKYRQQLRNMLKSVGDTNESNQTFCSSLAQERAQAIPNHTQTQSSSAIPQETRTTLSSTLNGANDSSTLQVLEYLVRLPQVNLECFDKDKRTPLLWAASSGNRDAILLLVQNGADLSSCDANRLGALHCSASHGFTDCLDCILTLAATNESLQVDQADNMNCTALFYAVLSGNIDCVESLLDRGASCDWQDVKGRTAAHFAALRGQLNSLKLLRERGGNLWLANKQGDLPLHYAIKSGRQQVVRWLLDHSPYENAVNAINNYGRAPIHLAVARDNLALVEYLIKCGANLDQLVKLRSSRNCSLDSQGSRYETALDLAKRLHLDSSLELLNQRGARSASQVLAARNEQVVPNKEHSDIRSLFELQSVEGPSPIGPSDTSEACTTTSASMHSNTPQAADRPAGVPKMTRPAAVADALPQSDSTGSSSMSQNSLTSVRGARASGAPPLRQTSRPAANNGPASYKRGGISYNNSLMNASIKCKLYDREHFSHHSFPPASGSHEQGYSKADDLQASKAPIKSCKSAESPIGNQVITKVNVYTPPCMRCSTRESVESKHITSEQGQRGAVLEQRGQTWDSDDTSSIHSTNSSSRSEVDSRHQLPSLVEHEASQAAAPSNLARPLSLRRYQHGTNIPLPLVGRHQPPSQGHEQQLPVILSDRERSASNSGCEQAYDEPAESPEAASRSLDKRRSPADEEPRFDWSQRAQHGLSMHHADVRSPVGDYIRQTRVNQPTRSKHRVQQRYASRSQSRQGQASRAASRATSHVYSPLGHLQRSSSTDSLELLTQVEKTIRKFKQEKKVFEELQNLKKSQIRSGRANEALLVKRLVEHFKSEAQQCPEMIGLDRYHGPYEYLAYERFLYDQLRKLSPSNSAKLAGWPDEQFGLTNLQSQVEEEQQLSNLKHFEEEDLQAELELQRVIGESSVQAGAELGDPNAHLVQPAIITQENQDVVDDQAATSRKASISSVCSSRRSSVEVEEDKLLKLPLRVQAHESSSSDIEDQANSLSSLIIVDALGNISQATQRSESEVNKVGVSKPMKQEKSKTLADIGPRRRLSVVNIGNKIETVEHQVGIEIDPADSSAAGSDQEQEQVGEETIAIGGRAGELDEISEHEDSEAEAETVISGQESVHDRSEPSQDIQSVASCEHGTASGNGDEQLHGELVEPKQVVDKGEQIALSAKPLAIYRRASSPQLIDSRSSASRTNSSSRRSSLDQSERKKVFNGYDLDQMRARSVRRRNKLGGRKCPRAARSELPSIKYVPRVDLESVRLRWAPIKAKFRQRLVDADEPGELVGSFGRQGAKSQPNLRSAGQLGEQQDEQPSYTLLYEINKCAALTSQAESGRSWQVHGLDEATRQLKWCQRRAVRIVDVRTLKRTLSLPESLIYSNDLLKRFNILKL